MGYIAYMLDCPKKKKIVRFCQGMQWQSIKKDLPSDYNFTAVGVFFKLSKSAYFC